MALFSETVFNVDPLVRGCGRFYTDPQSEKLRGGEWRRAGEWEEWFRYKSPSHLLRLLSNSKKWCTPNTPCMEFWCSTIDSKNPNVPSTYCLLFSKSTSYNGKGHSLVKLTLARAGLIFLQRSTRCRWWGTSHSSIISFRLCVFGLGIVDQEVYGWQACYDSSKEEANMAVILIPSRQQNSPPRRCLLIENILELLLFTSWALELFIHLPLQLLHFSQWMTE